MTPLANDRLLRALAREPVDRVPVWVMRQAGRYLPEYRAVRERAGDFLTLCRTPELACEVTLQPVDRFNLDAAIIFSDILTVPHAMGLGLHFVAGEGPRFEHPLRDERDIERLPIPDPEAELGYVMDALRATRDALAGRVPLIGFAGSPWTVATYMIEGRSSKDFARAKKLLLAEPEAGERLMNHLADATADYLEHLRVERRQRESGLEGRLDRGLHGRRILREERLLDRTGRQDRYLRRVAWWIGCAAAGERPRLVSLLIEHSRRPLRDHA